MEALKLQNDVNVVLFFFDRIFVREDPQTLRLMDALITGEANLPWPWWGGELGREQCPWWRPDVL